MDLAIFLAGRVRVNVGDITKEVCDAIVNTANGTLLGGGGVDGAIHRVGGKSILEQCRQIRRDRYPEGLPTGEAVITTAGSLPAKYVIHTVGPVYNGKPEQAQLLAACYRNSLSLAVSHDLATIAFPAISTGVYGYPRNKAAETASRTIEEFLRGGPAIQEVRLVFFADEDADMFLRHHVFSV